MKNIFMIGPDPSVMGGISTVVRGYLSSDLAAKNNITYISSHRDGSKLKKLLVALRAYILFIFKCISKPPDIIHIHSSFGASFYRKAVFIFIGRAFGIPIINHIHGAEFDKFYNNAGPEKKKLVRKVYSKCTRIIVLSREWEEKFLQFVEKDKICVIENFAEMPGDVPEIENRENYILFMGEVGKRKGAYDIPEVAERVAEIINDASFIICGNGETDKLKEIVGCKKLSGSISIMGWVGKEEKDSWFKRSKIYFLPSYNEGMPMSVLEAMAYGIPVVATNVGGIPALIENGENGFIHNPGSIDEFAASIIKILSDGKLCRSMSLNNMIKIRKNYSIELNVEKVQRLYSEIQYKGEKARE